jgi:predicted AAA+ superfamily ATPase
MEYLRTLNLKKRLGNRSGFLFGPRATGKTTLLKQHLPDSHSVDLLDHDTFSRLLRRPRLLGQELEVLPKAQRETWIIIDEIQKIPSLLDEVHRLIEKQKMKFILTGSSARKLKRGGANLLAGRARVLELFPLVYPEIPNINLEHYLNYGGLPLVHDSDDPVADLTSYVNTYLKEEIQAEALVRRLDHFARFMDVVGAQSGQELVFESIAQVAQVPTRTVANFIEVLKDTLLAHELEPMKFSGKKSRKVISRSKLYLFDVGVANLLAGRLPLQLRTDSAGQAFEHWMIQEVRAWKSYQQDPRPLGYWRTTQQHEVDLIIGEEQAIEFKFTQNVTQKDLKNLRALKEEGVVKNYSVVCDEKNARKTEDGIWILPWRTFLDRLWNLN